MISKTNIPVAPVSYPNKVTGTKQTKDNTNVSQNSDTDKVKQLKESISSGEYKVNIEALASKMADSLL